MKTYSGTKDQGKIPLTTLCKKYDFLHCETGNVSTYKNIEARFWTHIRRSWHL